MILGGRVKEHSDSFRCISLYMLMTSADPALSSVEEQRQFADNHKKYKEYTYSGGATDSSFSFNFLTKFALNCPSFKKAVWSKMFCAARHKLI